MKGVYRPREPGVYSAAWHEAVCRAAETPEIWYPIAKCATEGAALNRMKRLRAFRDSLQIWTRHRTAQAVSRLPGFRISFRKRQKGELNWWVEVRLTVQAVKVAELEAIVQHRGDQK